MQGANGSRDRLRELAAKIATGRDHDKFTTLVKEFNELLDGEKQPKELANPAPIAEGKD